MGSNTMKLLKPIDYIWCVGEVNHKRRTGPGDGETLIMVCWYLDILFPVITFVYRLGLDRMVMTLISLILIVIPFVFCRWRYNQSRREAILQRYRCERPGRALLWIWGAIVVIAGIEAVLMMCGGLWANGNVS